VTEVGQSQFLTVEWKTPWKLVKSGEIRPLPAADMALLLRLHFALQEYEAKVAVPKNININSQAKRCRSNGHEKMLGESFHFHSGLSDGNSM